MQATLLPVAVMNIQHEMDSVFPAVHHLAPHFEQRLTLCELFRQLAVGSLLLTADPRLFFAFLHRSARAFLDVLDRLPEDRTLASKFMPFLDAVASGDNEGARLIAAAAPETLRPDKEYEEDFLYMKLLMAMSSDPSREQVEAWLARFRELAETSPDPRFAVCEGIWEKDAAAFEESADIAIKASRAELARAMDEDTLDPDEAALRSVSVEVLAWMELARSRGLQVGSSHPLAPAIARALHLAPPIDPAGWRLGRAGV